jgi:hypothetical protein
MVTRSLTVQIDPTGLQRLGAADQLVAMVKSANNLTYAVIWQAIQPLSQNVISWDGTYQVYASTTALAPGAPLVIGASGAATGGNLYTFAGGQFTTATGGLPISQLGLYNQDDRVTINGIPMFTGGASESANVNGQLVTSPLDAQAVLYGDRAFCLLTEQVLVFPASGVGAGTLLDWSWLAGTAGVPHDVGIVLGVPLTVDLTTTNDQTIHYIDASNSFGLGPAP